MFIDLQKSLWKHFGASIDMLGNVISLWPEEKWYTDKKFFYAAYHCLVFLDYYLTIPSGKFSPSLPFTLTADEQIPGEAIDDVVPDEIYSKAQLTSYQQLCREKCQVAITTLTEEKIFQPWIDKSADVDLSLATSATVNYSVFDILLSNLRHVQHHTAQLNLLLRQQINDAAEYIGTAEDELILKPNL